MSDHWLYSQALPAGPADWTLQGDEAQHARAKRLEAGEAVHLFDGRGRVAAGRVVACEKRALSVRIERIETVGPRRPGVTVAVSPPKGERLDWMLEKLTELGVAAICPLQCERSVAQAKDERLDRWQRRLVEAAKQAHVAWLPTIEPSHKLAQILARAGEFTDLLVADTMGPTAPILAPALPGEARPVVLIGPEGGFSEGEREQMSRAGVRRVSLGPTVLRTETAAIVAAACLLAGADLANWKGTSQESRP